MTETKKARTPEQKAAHAQKERERRAARKTVEQYADEVVAERDAAEDFITDAAARLAAKGTTLQPDYAAAAHDAVDCSAGVEAHEAHIDLNGECPWKPVVIPEADLSGMDSVTLYRKVKEEIAEQKTNPDIATPHLDELNARKGRKVVGGAKAPKAPRRTSSTFDGDADHECSACHTVKPARTFPTVGGGRRGGECRACRDARRAAKDAATEAVEKGAAV